MFLVQVTCGGIAIHNNTYFTNEGFPNTFATPSSCTLTIRKCNPNICQVRVCLKSKSYTSRNV